MEIVLQLIFVVAILKYCLKAALSGRLLLIVGYGLVLAAVSFALYPIIISQPLTIITDLLASKTIVENIALITTAESAIGILISISLLDNYFRPKEKRTAWARFIKIMPGLVVFFAVAYFELLFFKWRVGGEFLVTSLLFSLVLLVGVVLVALLLKKLIEGESLKLEMKLIFNLAVLTLGLLISSSVADYNISNAQATIEWAALISIIVGSLVLVALGIWLHKINFKNKISKIIKWNK